MKSKNKQKKINWKVILYSIIALGFVWLMFAVDWLFVIGALVMIWLNQKEIMKKN